MLQSFDINVILTHFISSSIKVAKAPSLSLSLFYFSLSLSFSLSLYNHLYLELEGERKHKNNQAKIQFESKIRTSNQDYRGQKPDTKHWFKDLLEEDSEVESRPNTNHILAFTNKTNNQLPASSVTMFNICIKIKEFKRGHDLRILSLPRDSPRNNLYAWVI